jgi:aryl-alcohol dehydrogenase-like predicted oxidoreductase
LKTDYIDLYGVHAWDFMTPVEEVMRSLDDMVKSGKVLYTGISDTPSWIVSWANVLADQKGWTPFTGMQMEYSLIERNIERELLPLARTMDIALTPWGCLGSGLLSGKFNTKDSSSKRTRLNPGKDGRIFSERNLKIADAVISMAEETSRTPSQVALNWVRQQKGVIIPIIGVRSESQLNDNLGGLNFKLSDKQLQKLDQVSKIDYGFPHDFLAREPIQKIVYSGTREDIENHRE